jgi:photosystem II stability/assembly factor-like uncharacterized protein
MRFLTFTLLCFGLSINAQTLNFDTLQNLKIRNVGPANMSGRITSIGVVNANPKIIYVGAASGGVWKSENGGSAWTPVFDDQPTQNIGAVAIQQSNPDVIWVGTGEGNPRNSMNLGTGIFKSTDGGTSWKFMGLKATKTIHRIIIDPNDHNTVYVGAMGDPFTENEHRGLYKTIDGGENWTKTLYSNTSSGIADLVMDKSNSRKIFAALYEHHRTPYSFVSGGKGSGLYVSEDAGESWNIIGLEQGFPEGELGRIGIAIAPSNHNRIYAKVEAKKNVLFRSDDGGSSWVVINKNSKFTNNRPFYFQDLAVDTADEDRLYNIYQPLSVSYNGGKTFDTTPMIPADETKGIHADFHAMWINPKDAQHMIIGGDGGLGISYDHGKSWYFPESIPVAQLYHVNVDYETPFNVYAGMQDNGNWSGPAYTWKRGGIRTLYWQYLVGGDGFYIAPDKEDDRFGYGTSQNGDLYRYDKLTGYYQSIAPQSSPTKAPLRFNWNAGFAKDPADEKTAYYGSQFVHKTEDKGATWRVISSDLSTDNSKHQKDDYGGLTLDVSGAENYNSILSLEPSYLNRDLLWAGTDDGQVHLTQDGGKTWKNLTDRIDGLPTESWIAKIHASRYDESTAWIVVNNYRKGDYAPYLFKTEDYGASWSRIVREGDVNGYALSFIQDPVEKNLLFLGTENGLWISINKGNDWTQFKNGFPSVSTMDLVIQEKESALVVGTFGRAIWVLDDLLSLRAIISNNANQKLTALPLNEVVQVKGLFIAPPGNIWSGFHTTFEGKNRVFQKAEIPVFVKDTPKEKDSITVNIRNPKGELINTVTATDLKKGLNYVVWKLDEKKAYLQGSWINEETRGIPVLPGDYTLEILYQDETTASTIKVVTDPRFDLEKDVDKQLYQYQKSINQQVTRLAHLMNTLDDWEKKTNEKIEQLQKENSTSKKHIRKASAFKTKIQTYKLSLRDRPLDRQLGAWQSKKTTPYSATKQALKAAKSRVKMPSKQDWQRIERAKNLIDVLKKELDQFENNEWQVFMNMNQ